MDDYQVGKDVGQIKARLDAVERELDAQRCRHGSRQLTVRDYTAILATCNARKKEIEDRFVYHKFGSCSHPSDELANVEGDALLLLLEAEQPGCPDPERGNRSTEGAPITTYLAYAACKRK